MKCDLEEFKNDLAMNKCPFCKGTSKDKDFLAVHIQDKHPKKIAFLRELDLLSPGD